MPVPITTTLDLTIFDSHNINLLVIGDSSSYASGFTIVSPTVQVTMPGYGPKTLTFTKQTINIYNSNDLGITCDVDVCDLAPLPDGIYILKYAIAPAYQYNVTKTFIRVDNLLKKFDDRILDLEVYKCDSQLKRNIQLEVTDIEFYIQGAIAAANRCATTLAMELYNKANNLLNRLSKKCIAI